MSQEEKITELSAKNTKNEILEAYNDLLAKVRKTSQMNLNEIKTHQEEKAIVEKATITNSEDVVKKIANLKVSVYQEFDDLEQKIVAERRKLKDIHAAIAIESKNLQDLYGIKQNADSLAALILAQKELKAKFENEIAQEKAFQVNQKMDFEKNFKEEQETAKKERNREEEEYKYKLLMDRKKEKDLYEMNKQMLEKELEEKRIIAQKEFSERETNIKAKEEEFKKLQEQVKHFPNEMEKAVRDAEKATKTLIEAQYKHQIDLTTREIEGERRLNNHIIISLQDKIKEQEEYIKQLTQKANDSIKQVQSIAMKALEGNSPTRFYATCEDSKKSSQTTNL